MLCLGVLSKLGHRVGEVSLANGLSSCCSDLEINSKRAGSLLSCPFFMAFLRVSFSEPRLPLSALVQPGRVCPWHPPRSVRRRGPRTESCRLRYMLLVPANRESTESGPATDRLFQWWCASSLLGNACRADGEQIKAGIGGMRRHTL